MEYVPDKSGLIPSLQWPYLVRDLTEFAEQNLLSREYIFGAPFAVQTGDSDRIFLLMDVLWMAMHQGIYSFSMLIGVFKCCFAAQIWHRCWWLCVQALQAIQNLNITRLPSVTPTCVWGWSLRQLRKSDRLCMHPQIGVPNSGLRADADFIQNALCAHSIPILDSTCPNCQVRKISERTKAKEGNPKWVMFFQIADRAQFDIFLVTILMKLNFRSYLEFQFLRCVLMTSMICASSIPHFAIKMKQSCFFFLKKQAVAFWFRTLQWKLQAFLD